jgi:hypothetical protein
MNKLVIRAAVIVLATLLILVMPVLDAQAQPWPIPGTCGRHDHQGEGYGRTRDDARTRAIVQWRTRVRLHDGRRSYTNACNKYELCRHRKARLWYCTVKARPRV